MHSCLSSADPLQYLPTPPSPSPLQLNSAPPTSTTTFLSPAPFSLSLILTLTLTLTLTLPPSSPLLSFSDSLFHVAPINYYANLPNPNHTLNPNFNPDRKPTLHSYPSPLGGWSPSGVRGIFGRVPGRGGVDRVRVRVRVRVRLRHMYVSHSSAPNSQIQ